VMIVGSFIMMFFGVLGKVGAFFVAIPEPIIGGLYMTVFGKHSESIYQCLEQGKTCA
jgi:xanthine/uracil permease